MVSVNDLKTGLTIEYNKTLYQVMEFQHVKPGKGSAFVRTKLRNLDTGSIQDITFNAGEKVATAHVDRKTMQFLYKEGEMYNFMDNESYEQLSIEQKLIGSNVKYLHEGLNVQVVTYQGKIISINIPEKVTLEVVECEPGIKGDTKSGGDKSAVLETGATVRVPLFVEQGEKVIVNTTSGTYVSRG